MTLAATPMASDPLLDAAGGVDAETACQVCEDEPIDEPCACCGGSSSSAPLNVRIIQPTRRRGPLSRLSTSLYRSSPAAEARRALSLTAQKIDIHQHCTFGDDQGLSVMLRSNAACSIERAVLLALRPPGSTPQQVAPINEWVLSAAARHPNALVPFVTVVEDDPAADAMLSECVAKGARGLKLIGFGAQFLRANPHYSLVSESLMRCFAVAERHGLPVVAHVYVAYDEGGEGDDDGEGDGGGGVGGDDGMAPPRDLIGEVDTVLTAHPSLRFVLAQCVCSSFKHTQSLRQPTDRLLGSRPHSYALGFDSTSLPRLHTLLTKHPNLHIDTSLYGGARVKWFGRASCRAQQLRETVLAFPKQASEREAHAALRLPPSLRPATHPHPNGTHLWRRCSLGQTCTAGATGPPACTSKLSVPRACSSSVIASRATSS